MAFPDPNRRDQWRLPYHQDDLYWSRQQHGSSASSLTGSSEPQHHSLPPMLPDNSEIYESIYDSRWKLMHKEAARLHREVGYSSATSSPRSVPRWSTPPSPLLQVSAAAAATGSSSTASSRESSLGPSQQQQPAAAATLVLSAKSPRSIVVRKRGDGGFGFTLRHFIVYPPEDGATPGGGGGEEDFASVKEPMDTIFVKSVKDGGAAYHAGLRIGDRIVSVNGESVIDKSYGRVVQLIKRSGDNLKLIVVPQEDDILQKYFSEIAQNPETNQRPSGPPATATSTGRFSQTNKQVYPTTDEHVYAVPAFVREEEEEMGFGGGKASQMDPFLSRIRRETELKEQFLRRPVVQQKLPSAAPSSAVSHDTVENRSVIRRASDTLPPIPQDRVVDVVYQQQDATPVGGRRQSGQETLESDLLAAAADSVGLDTPEQQRKFKSITKRGSSDSVGDESKGCRKGSISGAQRSSVVSSESESSRKSSMSSGRKRSLFHSKDTGSGSSKQFAVTFFVNESEKTKLVDILHKAKMVISKKVEKVMGKKPAKLQASVSSAEALTSILETWVSQEEAKGKDEDDELQELIAKQDEQVKEMKKNGVDPSFLPATVVMPPTVVSPVPEESEEDEEEEDEKKDGDIAVQEVIEGQDNYLLCPPKQQRFQLSRSSTPGLSPRRSLSPCNGVPRHFNMPDSELYPPCLRRPSSHYDESAQAASSRPCSPNPVGAAAAAATTFAETDAAAPKISSTVVTEKEDYFEPSPITTTFVPSLGGIQRPESMTVPIGGIWRPDDSDVEESLFPEEDLGDSAAGGQHRRSLGNGMTHWLTSEGCDSFVAVGNKESSFPTTDSRKSSSASSANNNHRQSPHVASATNSHVQKGATQKEVVRRRQSRSHITQEEAEERNLRRTSYLKATKDDRGVQVEAELEEEDCGHHQVAPAMGNNKKLTVAAAEKHSPSIQKIRSLFGEQRGDISDQIMSAADSPPPSDNNVAATDLAGSGGSTVNLAADGEGLKEGWLTCKVAAVEGKKANDRSWKQVYVVLKSQAMFLYRDKKGAVEHPLSCEEPPVTLSESQVEVADDYTKRKHVFRIRTDGGSEYLFQAEGENNMREWIEAIEETVAALVVVAAAAAAEDRKEAGAGGKGLKKLTSFRNRSPSAHSPAAKTRKASQDQGLASKESKDKQKTWKGKVAKQWKKMHHGSNAVTEMNAYPEGGSIGVPLEDCPMCDSDQLYCSVPLLITTCCGIVEERGLEIVGVYRVPGNSAAVSFLTEQINAASARGTEGFRSLLQLEDHRWNDVNVVSSLLKSFFRKLPEPLFTNELYPYFIEACKLEDASLRLNTLKKLCQDLPECNYETLKYMCRHLGKVMAHSDVNKMEVRNLAIVFGPTLVRTADDNMLSMVTDMAQQCRIIESMLSNCEWFFNGEEVASGDAALSVTPHSISGLARITHTGNETLLLNNLQKLEDAGKVSSSSPAREVSAKDIVSGIISAANRKIQRTSGGGGAKMTVSPAAGGGGGGKRDSVDHAGIERIERLQRLDTPTRCVSVSNSRRNSESVIHSAMAIAAAVPHLMGGKDCSSANSSASSIPAKLNTELLKPNIQQQHLFKHLISVSAENISHQQQQQITTSSSQSVTTRSIGHYGVQQEEEEEEERKPSPFPIDTYTGLEEATAKRIKRFEEETRAMLARSQGVMQVSTADNTSVNSDQSTLERWMTDLDEGIIVQTAEVRCIPHTQDRFVSLTYGCSPVADSTTSDSSSSSPANHRLRHSRPQKKEVDSHLVRGMDSNRQQQQRQPPESTFDTQKVASNGTLLKRHRYHKANTEPQLSLLPEERTKVEATRRDLQGNSECDDVLNSLTASFDEKLRLLLDPHYQSSGTSIPNFVSLSVHSSPSKYLAPRRTSEYSVPNFARENKLRSNSAGNREQNFPSRECTATASSHHNSGLPVVLSPPRKSDLRRGRFVDKNKERSSRQSHQLKRNDSLTKREKQAANNNTRKKEAEKENNCGGPTPKILKTLANQRKLKRRHTVGGTKDFGDWEKILVRQQQHQHLMEEDENAKDNCCWIDDLNLLILEPWLEQQQEVFMRKQASSPDLTSDARRLSLPPDSIMESSSSTLMRMSMLESQV